MVHQPLGQGVREHQLALGHRDEAVAQPVVPELRAAGLADPAMEIGQLHEIARSAGGRRKTPNRLRQVAALEPTGDREWLPAAG